MKTLELAQVVEVDERPSQSRFVVHGVERARSRGELPAVIRVEGVPWAVNFAAPIDVSIPIDPGSNEHAGAFFLPNAVAEAVRVGTFVGDTREGGSCNCSRITLCPHGNGTHTECVGHVTNERIVVSDVLDGGIIPSVLLSVSLEPIGASGDSYPWPHAGGELVITRRGLQRALRRLDRVPPGFFEGLVLRTMPNPALKKTTNWSGRCPPYVSVEAMHWIADLGVRHLCVDLPSLDREEDGGMMTAHRIFWDLPGSTQIAGDSTKTVTEMIYVPEPVADGFYFLNLQIAPLALDAAPSRPILFAARRLSSVLPEREGERAAGLMQGGPT